MAQISYIKYLDIIQAGRYDSEYFKSEYLITLKIIKNQKYLQNNMISQIKSGTTPKDRDENLKNGVILLKTGNIRNNILIDEKDVFFYINESTNFKMKSTELKVNDVLINIVGATTEVVGRTALITDNLPKANITQAMAICRVFNSEISPNFFFIFLQTRFGKNQIKRLARPTGQFNLNLEEIGKIIVPVLLKTFQSKISDIVDIVNNKQKKVKELYNEAEKLLLRELELLDYHIANSLTFSTTKLETVGAKRIDSEYFHPKFKVIFDKIEKYSEGFDTVGNQFQLINGKTPSEYFADKGEVQILKTKEIRKECLNYENVVYTNEDLVGSLLEEKDIVLASMGVGSLGRTGIFYNFETDKKTGVDSTIKILRKIGIVEPEVLQVFLNSIVGQQYIYRYVVGSTGIISIKNNDIKNIKIPLIRESVQKQIAEKIEESHNLRKESKELLEQAKKMVENEIQKNANS